MTCALLALGTLLLFGGIALRYIAEVLLSPALLSISSLCILVGIVCYFVALASTVIRIRWD